MDNLGQDSNLDGLEPSLSTAPSSSDPKWGHLQTNRYVMTRTSGFFSEASTALQDLARLGPRARSIDSTRAFRRFKDSPNHDLFGEIFARPRGRIPSSQWFARHMPHHGRYCDLPFTESRMLVQRWFRLKRKVKSRAVRLSKEKGLDPARTIAVNLRGSDKHVEVEPTPVSAWVEFVTKLNSSYPELDIWVFSEDQDLVDEFLHQAPFPVRDFGQKLRTRQGQAMRFALRDFASSRTAFAIDFVAQTWLISRSRFVVTYTGNTGYWTALFRGCAWGLFQFTRIPGTVSYSTIPCVEHSEHRESLTRLCEVLGPAS